MKENVKTDEKIFSFGEMFATCAIITVISFFFGGFLGDAGANKTWENRMVQYDCCQYNPTTGDFEILAEPKQ